jgi:hypothetical protein
MCINCGDSTFRTWFQHFILRFNEISLLYGYQLKEGLGAERRPQDRVNLRISPFYLSSQEVSQQTGEKSCPNEIQMGEVEEENTLQRRR